MAQYINPQFNEMLKNDPRYGLASQLLQSGLTPQSGQAGLFGALAQSLTAGLGAYETKNLSDEYKGRQQNASTDLATALGQMNGTPASTQQYGDGTSIDWQENKPDMQAGLRTLASNPDLADTATNLQLQNLKSTQDSQSDLAKLKLANELKGSEPITPYQQAQLKFDQDKLDAGGGGISYTMPDGTSIQIGGTGKGNKLSESQQAAASRATLLDNGLSRLEQTVTTPGVSPLRMAIADTVKGSPLGDLAATKMQTDKENISSAGRDAALEGFASAVTGAGVTNDQFTRFKNMLPKPADSAHVQNAKFADAYNFLLTQTNIAGPIADQIKEHAVARMQANNQGAGQVGMPAASGGSSTIPQPVKIPDANAYQALPSGTQFVAPDGSLRVKP